jgi:G3E family GTPase
MTKVNVISGFLGAGKTTLIQKLLKDVFHDQKVVLVENEFGEIGIDGGFLQDAGIIVNEVNGGCICCTLQGDFQKALAKVRDTYQPDHILIEPSGVGKLSDILAIVKSVEGLDLDSYSTVVDAKRCKIYHKNFKEFFDDQIATASCVILSRTQMIDETKLQEDLDIIHALNPKVRVITTPWNDLSGMAIFEAMTGSGSGFPKGIEAISEEDEDDEDEHEHHDHEHHHDHDDAEAKANEGLREGNRIHIGAEEEHEHHHHHHGLDADDVFDSIGIETINKYSAEELQSALSKLPDNIVRAKGIVPAKEGGWLFFDYVPGDVDVRPGTPAYTGLITVIGEHVDVEQMKNLFGVH